MMVAGTHDANADDVSDLYRELIIDHSRHPRHFGQLDNATHVAEGINPLCGDRLRLYLQLDEDDSIRDASFEGSGCAISVASASLLTDLVIGIDTSRALAYSKEITERLSTADAPADLAVELEKLMALDGVRRFPSRVKCATLAWHALKSALLGKQAAVSTE